jgi:hypothetical protein
LWHRHEGFVIYNPSSSIHRPFTEGSARDAAGRLRSVEIIDLAREESE